MGMRYVLKIGCLLLLFVPLSVYAKDLVMLETVYEYQSDNENETPRQATYKAIERAKIKALEEHFGVEVSQVNASWNKNKQEDSAVSSASHFLSMSSSAVGGVWVKSEKETVLSTSFEKGFWLVKVQVKGLARKKKQSEIQISADVLKNCTGSSCVSTQFSNGEQLYMRFSSPVNGFLCVYLVDEEQMAYCLLPDQYATTGRQEIKANTEYVFFSADNSQQLVDEYVLTTEKSVEHNVLYVVFSPNDFVKSNVRTSHHEVATLPLVQPYKDFLLWLSKHQIADEDMVVKKEIITITQ